MADKTTRQHAPLPTDSPDFARLTLHHGNRYRCAGCHEAGKDGEPTMMCHHCGRLLCAACAAHPPRYLGWLFQHQEVSWRTVRGQRSRLGPTRMEAVHCNEHVHYVPRMMPWLIVGFWLTGLVGAALYVAGADAGWVTLGPVLFFTVWALAGMVARLWDRRHRQQLFFPVEGEPATFELQEFFEAMGELDREYRETWRRPTQEARRLGRAQPDRPTDPDAAPYGLLVATIPLHPALGDELAEFRHAQGLSETRLAQIPATAGSIVLEEALRVVGPTMRWEANGQRVGRDAPPWTPGSNSRRWLLAEPVWGWFSEDGSPAAEKTLSFDYRVDWWIPRLPFRMAFPVQVQAHFAEDSGRRTLALQFHLMGRATELNPFIRSVEIAPGDNLPPFTVMPALGRTVAPRRSGRGQPSVQFEVDDLRIANNVAELLLRFDEPPSSSGQAWLTGTIRVGMVGLLSGLRVAGVFDPFGFKVQRPRLEILSWATLTFRVNVASLPSQQVHALRGDFVLSHNSAARDDAIVRALQQQFLLTRVRERAELSALSSWQGDGPALPPMRELAGSPLPNAQERAPLLFTVELRPASAGTHVHVRVEETVGHAGESEQRAVALARKLRSIIEGADAAFG